MGRNLNRSKAQYKLRCMYYKPVVNDRKIIRDEKIAGIFWARPTSQNKTPLVNGSVRMILFTTTIETPDDISSVSVDYFVEYHGDIHRVINIEEMFIGNGRKNYSLTLQREVRE